MELGHFVYCVRKYTNHCSFRDNYRNEKQNTNDGEKGRVGKPLGELGNHLGRQPPGRKSHGRQEKERQKNDATEKERAKLIEGDHHMFLIKCCTKSLYFRSQICFQNFSN